MKHRKGDIRKAQSSGEMETSRLSSRLLIFPSKMSRKGAAWNSQRSTTLAAPCKLSNLNWNPKKWWSKNHGTKTDRPSSKTQGGVTHAPKNWQLEYHSSNSYFFQECVVPLAFPQRKGSPSIQIIPEICRLKVGKIHLQYVGERDLTRIELVEKCTNDNSWA